MSIKNKVIAAAATLTLVGGVGAMGTLTAHAATPSCGYGCVDIFSRDFGTKTPPNFVLDTLRQGEKVGQPQILFRTANFDPAEDYTFSYQGTVADFFAAGLASAAVNLHYGAPGATDPVRPGWQVPERQRVRDPVLALRRGQRPVHGRRRDRRCRVRRSRCSRAASLPRRSGSSDSAGPGRARLRAADQRVGHQLLAPTC